MDSSAFDDSEYMQNILQLYNDPWFAELRKFLTFEQPSDTAELFKRVNQIYNQNNNSPFDEIRNRSNRSNYKYAHRLFFEGVQGGLIGCYYHLNNFLAIEEVIKRSSSKIVSTLKPKTSMTLGIPSQNLIFEYEAFTYSCRSTLDRWCWFLDYYFEQDASNLQKLNTVLMNNFQNNVRAMRIVDSIKRHQSFIDLQISSEKGKTERDRIAHREQINFTTINVFYQHESNSVNVQLISPYADMVQSASDLLILRASQLKDFVKDSIQNFFNV